MPHLSRQVIAVGCAALVGGATVLTLTRGARDRAIDAGFWFEQVAFDSPALGSPLTLTDMGTIAAIARSELTRAFAGLRVRLSDRRDARYSVRVVQELRDLRFRRRVGIAGESRAIRGFGGAGSVNFEMLASNAVGYAAPDADRETMIAAIGRGIGRAAVHEFTHQFLPTAPIHDTTNLRSYEYAAAARVEQYYGEMQWDLAWPLLQQRVGRTPTGRID